MQKRKRPVYTNVQSEMSHFTKSAMNKVTREGPLTLKRLFRPCRGYEKKDKVRQAYLQLRRLPIQERVRRGAILYSCPQVHRMIHPKEKRMCKGEGSRLVYLHTEANVDDDDGFVTRENVSDKSS